LKDAITRENKNRGRRNREAREEAAIKRSNPWISEKGSSKL